MNTPPTLLSPTEPIPVTGGAIPGAAVTVRDLTVRYGSMEAVRGVSLDLRRGEIYGLLGPNGAGKTSIISVLSFLRPATSGTVRFGSEDSGDMPRDARHLLGVVPQDLALYPSLSAWENLAFLGRLYGLHGAVLRERVKEALAFVALEDRAKAPVKTFSGGMQRRLNLAAALLHRPRVLLLDEPTVGVDPQSRNHLFESIRALNEQGVAILYTTHYMEEAQCLCHRVGIIDGGRVVAEDTPERLMRRLGRGRIELRLNQPGPLDTQTLARIPHVLAAHPVVEGRLVLEADEPQRALIAVLQVLESQGIGVTNLSLSQPNLESVFLALTGKTLRD